MATDKTASNGRPQSVLSEIPPQTEVIPILDFGGQYAQLIARRVREAGAFSLLVAPNISLEELRAMKPRGVIMSGGPASVNEPNAPRCDERIFELGVPILGICYGMQLFCQILGSDVTASQEREYGRAKLTIKDSRDLFKGIPTQTTVWMSHGDQVMGLSQQFDTLASTTTCPFAAVRHKQMPLFGVQFLTEVTHTPHGVDIMRNFICEACGCTGTWRMTDFVESEIARIRKQVGSGRVICGLSGGVDSSVTAALITKAIGKQLTCIFVDNGLLRKNERGYVDSIFRDHFKVDLRVIDAEQRFLEKLSVTTDPEQKRKIIGYEFIAVFEEESKKVSNAGFLAQGTLYPDVIESVSTKGPSHVIKSHHN